MGGEWRRNIEQRLGDLESWSARTDSQFDSLLLSIGKPATNPPPEPTGLTPELRAKVEAFIKKKRYHPGGPEEEPYMRIPDVWVLVDMLTGSEP